MSNIECPISNIEVGFRSTLDIRSWIFDIAFLFSSNTYSQSISLFRFPPFTLSLSSSLYSAMCASTIAGVPLPQTNLVLSFCRKINAKRFVSHKHKSQVVHLFDRQKDCQQEFHKLCRLIGDQHRSATWRPESPLDSESCHWDLSEGRRRRRP